MSESIQNWMDDGIFEFSQNQYDRAIEYFQKVLEVDPKHFDATTSLAMAHYRLGNFPKAIEFGKVAESLSPNDPTVHTNLSLFFMRNGEKEKAEHHGLQAKISAWKSDHSEPASQPENPGNDALNLAQPKPQNIKIPPRFPDMPWKKS
ncbi:MAG: tetratricopeptide repeat protein [Verrucomicrobia bacterium]|nr:tetratricopeptide repeat protein [Verrucomicrobiota bacterium]